MENTFDKEAPTCPESPTDSLGRRVATVKGFSDYNDKTLSEMMADLDLFMSLSDLAFCRDHYARRGRNDVSLSEIYLLDELVKASRGMLRSASVTELLTDNSDIRETYSDLYEKHRYLRGDSPLPLSIEAAAGTCFEYLCKIGAYNRQERNIPPCAEEKLSLNMSSIAQNTAFVMLTPTEENLDYLPSALEFIAEAEDAIICAREIDMCGIASALADMADGVYADLSAIPQMPSVFELSHLITECHGAIVVATKKELLPELIAIAEGFGLSLAYFAKAVSSDTLTVRYTSGRMISVDTALRSSLQAERFELCGEVSEYFYRAVNTTISAILSAVCLGSDRSQIRLNTRYLFPSALTPLTCSCALATVLGAYRVMCELCLPDIPKIKYRNDDETYFDATAYISIGRSDIPREFSAERSYVYLLSFDRTESGLPNFSSFRSMCDFYRTCVITSRVISAKAIEDTPRNTIVKMDTLCRFCAAENISDILDRRLQGMIVESSEPLKFGILLGEVAPNGEIQTI